MYNKSVMKKKLCKMLTPNEMLNGMMFRIPYSLQHHFIE